MNKYNKLLEEIEVAFPEATSVTLHITTSHKEIDEFREVVLYVPVTTDTYDDTESRYLRYNQPNGTIILTNGSR